MSRLGLGIVGCGNIFERGYLPALADPGVAAASRVVGVCDLDPARAERARERTGALLATTSAEELWRHPDVDAVFLLTPTHTHASLAIGALEAGRDVLCEKPISRNLADGRRMIEAAARSRKRLFVGQTRRFDDRWRAVRELVAGRRIGELLHVFRSEHSWNGAPPESWQWRPGESGGVLFDVGVHGADLLAWLFESAPESVWARPLTVRPEAEAGGVADGAVLAFDFGPARSALLSLSWFHPPSWGPFYASMELIGSLGRVDFSDRDAHSLVVARDGLEVPRHSPLLSSMANTFARELRHFLGAIAAGSEFEVTAGDALAAVACLEAAERSFGSGRPEPVEVTR